MKPTNSKIIKREDEYPPNTSGTTGYMHKHKGYVAPTANLSVIFVIGDSFVDSISTLGIVAKYPGEVPAQRVVISILDPKNRRQWTTSLRTQAGLEWACAFDEKEVKSLKPYFKAGNKLEVKIGSLKTLELNVSLVQFERQSSQTLPRVAKVAMKSKAAGRSV